MNKTYGFPEGITNIVELIESEDFKKFVNENNLSKSNIELLGAIRRSSSLEGMTSTLIVEQKECQSIIVKYLKSLNKKYKYNFLRAYDGFSKNNK